MIRVAKASLHNIRAGFSPTCSRMSRIRDLLHMTRDEDRRALRLKQPERAAPQVVVVPQVRLRPNRTIAPQKFEDFFRDAYRDLVGRAMLAGATTEEAHDAASETLTEMLLLWPLPGSPLAYARRAVVSNFIQAKTRGPLRLLERLIARGHASRKEGAEDGGLSVFENDSWVEDVLSELPDGLRAVMRCIADGVDREEIANRLGISRAADRRRICDARARLAEILNPDGEFKQRRSPVTRISRKKAR